jgi:hypothetical protein
METLSRVVPGLSKATTRSSPRMRLISVDLPALGRPTTAICTRERPRRYSSVLRGGSSSSDVLDQRG